MCKMKGLMQVMQRQQAEVLMDVYESVRVCGPIRRVKVHAAEYMG